MFSTELLDCVHKAVPCWRLQVLTYGEALVSVYSSRYDSPDFNTAPIAIIGRAASARAVLLATDELVLKYLGDPVWIGTTESRILRNALRWAGGAGVGKWQL